MAETPRNNAFDRIRNKTSVELVVSSPITARAVDLTKRIDSVMRNVQESAMRGNISTQRIRQVEDSILEAMELLSSSIGQANRLTRNTQRSRGNGKSRPAPPKTEQNTTKKTTKKTAKKTTKKTGKKKIGKKATSAKEGAATPAKSSAA